MAKVKSKFFNALENPLAGHSKMHASVSGNSLAFYTTGGDIIARTKPKTVHRLNAVQLAQQVLWKDADCMWKHMTWGQKTLWNNYYYDEYRAGRTKQTAANRQAGDAKQIPPSDMGSYSFFMSRGLKFDLYQWLTLYMRDSWQVTSIIDTGDTIEVTASLVNPQELTEANVFPEHAPVRGY